MVRFLVSLIIGLLIGIAAALFVGWQLFPAQFVNSPAASLAEPYKDSYTVMVAAGYLEDQDLGGAVERLRILGVENIPAYVQAVTERYISNSRNAQEIGYLVSLAEGLGRLTPIMEPYRQLAGQTTP
jgi:hypothetical protein